MEFMRSGENEQLNITSKVIPDLERNNSYLLGKFLGMGSFGRCFVLTETKSGKVYAAKIVDKAILKHPIQSYFLLEELAIHKSLRHKNIVSFYDAFMNDKHIFIILELCSYGTLMELQKRRNCVTLMEAKYYLNKIINGVSYLHRKHIVHGDLKLSNVFITKRMAVKIGDFGLATSLKCKEQEIQIRCGTPNYMAPEIVLRKGHSYAGDIWAIGCILYALLVGQLPFQAPENELTYDKITDCDFTVYVPGLRKQVAAFIKRIFQKEPENRPSIVQLKKDEFLQGFIPPALPEYALWDTPSLKDITQGKADLARRYSSKGGGRCRTITTKRKRTKSSLLKAKSLNRAVIPV